MQKGFLAKHMYVLHSSVSRLNLMNGISNIHIRLLLICLYIFQNRSWSVKDCKTLEFNEASEKGIWEIRF